MHGGRRFAVAGVGRTLAGRAENPRLAGRRPDDVRGARRGPDSGRVRQPEESAGRPGARQHAARLRGPAFPFVPRVPFTQELEEMRELASMSKLQTRSILEVVLVLASLGLLGLNQSGSLGPVKGALLAPLTALQQWVAQTWNGAEALFQRSPDAEALRQRNAELEAENARLKAQAAAAAEDRATPNALLQASRERGVVVGQLAGGLEMQNISQQTKLAPDDVVLTSGLGGKFPPGVIIGTVNAVQKDRK